MTPPCLVEGTPASADPGAPVSPALNGRANRAGPPPDFGRVLHEALSIYGQTAGPPSPRASLTGKESAPHVAADTAADATATPVQQAKTVETGAAMTSSSANAEAGELPSASRRTPPPALGVETDDDSAETPASGADEEKPKSPPVDSLGALVCPALPPMPPPPAPTPPSGAAPNPSAARPDGPKLPTDLPAESTNSKPSTESGKSALPAPTTKSALPTELTKSMPSAAALETTPSPAPRAEGSAAPTSSAAPGDDSLKGAPEGGIERPVSPPPIVSADGTTTAPLNPGMNNAAKQDEFAAAAVQKLPTETAGAVSAAPAPANRRLAKDAPVTAPVAVTAFANAERRATPIETAPAEPGPTSAADPARVERLAHTIASEATLLRQFQTDRLSVVLKPDAETQIRLQFTQHNGLIEATARCDQGDLHFLSAHWPELQQRLEPQGIRLLDLAGAGGSFGAGGDSSQRHFQPPVEPAESVFVSSPALQTATSPVQPIAVRAATRTNRLLESWA